MAVLEERLTAAICISRRRTRPGTELPSQILYVQNGPQSLGLHERSHAVFDELLVFGCGVSLLGESPPELRGKAESGICLYLLRPPPRHVRIRRAVERGVYLDGVEELREELDLAKTFGQGVRVDDTRPIFIRPSCRPDANHSCPPNVRGLSESRGPPLH
jgi:hypothetical protein